LGGGLFSSFYRGAGRRLLARHEGVSLYILIFNPERSREHAGFVEAMKIFARLSY